MKKLLNIFLNLNLRKKFLISYILIALVSISMVSISTYKTYESNSKNNAIVYSKNLVEQIASNISFKSKDFEDNILLNARNSNLFVRTRYGDDLAERYYHDDLDNFAIRLSILRSEIKEVYLQDRDMKIFYSKNKIEQQEYENSDIHQYIKENFKRIRNNWGIPIWIRFNNNPGIVYMIRVISDFNTIEYQGIIAVGIDENYFKGLYSNLDKEQSRRVIIYNNTGDVLASDEGLLPMADYFKKSIVQNVGLYSTNEKYNGKDYMITSCTSMDSKWVALYIVSTSDLLKDAYKIRMSIVIACIVSFILAVIIAVIISSNITSNIHLLLKKIKLIEDGNFTTHIEPSSYDEIGQLSLKFNAMAGKLNDLIEKITFEQTEKQKAHYKALQSEYYALQTQINPHFIYNVLESVNSFAKIKGQSEIVKIITSLGKLLRVSIGTKDAVISFKEELEYVKSYLSIQKIILGDRIEVEYDIDEDTLECRVPKLILQPLVENAIVHGIEGMRGGGMVVISAYCSDRLTIKVSDNGRGMDEQTVKRLFREDAVKDDEGEKRTHIGIRSVNRRIRILYGNEYGLKINSEIGIGTVVEVQIPANLQDGGMQAI